MGKHNIHLLGSIYLLLALPVVCGVVLWFHDSLTFWNVFGLMVVAGLLVLTQ